MELPARLVLRVVLSFTSYLEGMGSSSGREKYNRLRKDQEEDLELG
jgi:hypothetical protein